MHSGWQVVVVAAAVGIGDRLFWTVNAPLTTALTDGRDVEKLIGTQTIARFAGAGIGAAAVLHGPQWIPGVAILVSTVVIVLGQRPWLCR